jgi:hypothetical protein
MAVDAEHVGSYQFVSGLQASRKLYFVHTFSLIRLLCGSRHHHADGGNHRSGFVKEQFIKHPEAQKAIRLAGFRAD